MGEITVGNTTIQYSERTSTRAKRLRIVVKPHNVELVTPPGVNSKWAKEFIEQKKQWVFVKLNEMNERAARQQSVEPFQYQSGAKILYRGRRLKLQVIETDVDKPEVTYSNKFIVSVPYGLNSTTRRQQVQKALEKWMKEKVRKDVGQFITVYSEKLKVSPKGYRIKGQKHLWGSCSSNDIININWRLIQAPKQVLEYVVVHEMCHLIHRNHSADFWNLTTSIFPDVVRCKKWLKSGEGWQL